MESSTILSYGTVARLLESAVSIKCFINVYKLFYFFIFLYCYIFFTVVTMYKGGFVAPSYIVLVWL